jgi:tRNA (guanine-N7-)-methyltransferase
MLAAHLRRSGRSGRIRRVQSAVQYATNTAETAMPDTSVAASGASSGKGRRKRVRQHANPLSTHNLVQTAPPDWGSVFCDPSLPLHLDVGCGHGKFAAALAQRNAGAANILGLEIREACVTLAEENGYTASDNLHLIPCNATTSLASLLRHYPGPVERVLLLHPDPQDPKQ